MSVILESVTADTAHPQYGLLNAEGEVQTESQNGFASRSSNVQLSDSVTVQPSTSQGFFSASARLATLFEEEDAELQRVKDLAVALSSGNELQLANVVASMDVAASVTQNLQGFDESERASPSIPSGNANMNNFMPSPTT